MVILPGTSLGRYEIRSPLGKGGMGEVYLAYDSSLRRQVAVKLLPVESTQDKARLSRFEREAYAASSLNHPNILTIHEIGRHDEHHFIATEYIDGESLRQRLTRTRMELREILDVVQQIASALAAAHHAGIVHRDIKPENIMLRQDGYVKVLDFGLAKLADDKVATQQAGTSPEAPTKTTVVDTEPGMVMGTASYMSPEQARGLVVDERSDIWSLGAMLYEMVAGRLPFEGATTTDVLSLILHHEPPSLLFYSSDTPAELERIVEKALAKEKEERYQSAKDLSIDLKRLKQRLEMEVEMERSITPEEVGRGGGRLSGSSQEPIPSGVITKPLAAARTAEASAAHTVSSAEYVVAEIKRHKRGAAITLAAFAIPALVAFAYFAYFGGRTHAITSIAVLPFTNTGGDPNMEYLSDGLSESLINALSQVPQLKVIARSSAFKYKGKEADPQEVAKALGVQAILTGRVAQRGDNLVVSAEMVDAREKTQLWGEQYSRKATDLQAVQEEIARTISEKLQLRLSGAQEQQLTKRATANAQAYQLYLNGVFYRRKSGSENFKKSLDYFNQAVALDPNFALASAGVAQDYIYLGENGVLDPKEALAKAKTAAQRALEIDGTLAEAHLVLADIKADEWDWAGAASGYKRAIELNSSLADAHSRYSDHLSFMGRHKEAEAEIERAQQLDPLKISLKLKEGTVSYIARRYDEAIERLRQVIKIDPEYGLAHVYLGYTYAAKGMYPQAIAAYQKYISIDGETTSVQCFLGHALAMSGKRNEAQAILTRLKTTREYVSPAELAVLFAGLGDEEGAIASLERAYAAHDLQLGWLKVEPHYDTLRSDPRFQDLMRRLGLA